MVRVSDIANYLESLAPSLLAEKWDNIGLLLGDSDAKVSQIMTCLTVTRESVQEAIESNADLIVAHHPLPFRPLQRITTREPAGNLIWRLAKSGISLCCSHTAFDSADGGINAQLAEKLGLLDVKCMVPSQGVAGLGAGRWGRLGSPATLAEIADRIRGQLDTNSIESNLPASTMVSTVAIACGSGASFLEQAHALNCHCLITGEASFHKTLEASFWGIGLLQIGHFASERFAMDRLAEILQERFSDCAVWASQRETSQRIWL